MRQPRGVEILDAVTAKALGDEQYKQRLKKDPKTVLIEEGLEVPDEIEIEILENTATKIYLVLPSETADEIDLITVDIRIIAHHTGGT